MASTSPVSLAIFSALQNNGCKCLDSPNETEAQIFRSDARFGRPETRSSSDMFIGHGHNVLGKDTPNLCAADFTPAPTL